jgi:ribosomal protein L29
MKYSEIKKLPQEETEKKFHELKTELMKLNAQVAIGTTPKSTKQIREIKKNIARMETSKNEEFRKELNKLGKKPKIEKRYKHH